jgi:hypothetical protein
MVKDNRRLSRSADVGIRVSIIHLRVFFYLGTSLLVWRVESCTGSQCLSRNTESTIFPENSLFGQSVLNWKRDQEIWTVVVFRGALGSCRCVAFLRGDNDVSSTVHHYLTVFLTSFNLLVSQPAEESCRTSSCSILLIRIRFRLIHTTPFPSYLV